MSNDPDPERLKALEKRLKQVRGTEEKEHAGDKAYNQAQYAWQMVVELIAGLGIGFGIGYGLDALWGTKPIMMVLFIMLGFAAGVKVMLGTAAHMQKSADADAGTTPGTRSEEEEGKTGG